MGTRLLILGGEVFNLGKNLFTSGAKFDGGGELEVYLWAERTLLGKFESLGGEDGLVGGSEPAVDIEEDHSMTTGNEVVRGLESS